MSAVVLREDEKFQADRGTSPSHTMRLHDVGTEVALA